MTAPPLPPTSFAEDLAALVAAHPDGPRMLAETLASLTDVEAAALAYDWEGVWCRPKQVPPDGEWQTWGSFGARGLGKSAANGNYVTAEAMSGRAMRIALIAQNEDKCLEVMVHGSSGLVTLSPPWCKARFELGRVIYPNGAQAFVYTPEVPKDIFGPEHHLVWASELHVWPVNKREEAWSNLMMGLRLGYGRLAWDSNPAKRHPILAELFREEIADPARNVIRRGSSFENRLNMTPGMLERWLRLYGGTARGREMLYGEQLADDEGALWQQVWIDQGRRAAPSPLRRRVIAVDPAISLREGTDDTGIIDAGLGYDAQCYPIADLTGRHSWEAWGDLVVKRYFAGRCDCVVLERNRGGDACASNVRACAAKVGARVEIVKGDANTRHVPGVIYIKEVVGRSSKATRAEPVATHTEAGRVSFPPDQSLAKLEELLTSWDPEAAGESPNALDAFVWAILELADLSRDARPDASAAVHGAAKMQAALSAQRQAPRVDVARLLGGAGNGGRI